MVNTYQRKKVFTVYIILGYIKDQCLYDIILFQHVYYMKVQRGISMFQGSIV